MRCRFRLRFFADANQARFVRLSLATCLRRELQRLLARSGTGYDQLRLEAAGGFQNGFRRAVLEVDGGVPQKAAPEQIDHKAQHVMEGQKRQRTAVGFFYNAAVFLIDQLGVEHLLGDGFAVVDENLALARGAAGAQGHALAERTGRKPSSGSVAACSASTAKSSV